MLPASTVAEILIEVAYARQVVGNTSSIKIQSYITSWLVPGAATDNPRSPLILRSPQEREKGIFGHLKAADNEQIDRDRGLGKSANRQRAEIDPLEVMAMAYLCCGCESETVKVGILFEIMSKGKNSLRQSEDSQRIATVLNYLIWHALSSDH